MMKKKMLWLVITCLTAGIITYAVLGFDSNTVSAELSQQAKGTFVRAEDGGKKLVVNVNGQVTEYPISDKVWVYRNMQKSDLSQLQSQDAVDIILNSKNQAAYIKAASPELQAKETPVASGAAVTQTEGAAAEAAEPANSAGLQPSIPDVTTPSGSSPSASAGAAASTASGVKLAAAPADTAKNTAWDQLSFEWKGRDLVLEVKLNANGAKEGNELYLKRKDRSVIHLTGDAASTMAQLFLKGLPADRSAYEQALKNKIAAEFQVSDSSPDWKMNVGWKAASPASVNKDSLTEQQKAKAKAPDKTNHDADEKQKEKDQKKEKEKGKSSSHKNDEDD